MPRVLLFWPGFERLILLFVRYAQVVKLVDTRVLEARTVRCVGSSPILGTKKIKNRPVVVGFLFLMCSSIGLEGSRIRRSSSDHWEDEV